MGSAARWLIAGAALVLMIPIVVIIAVAEDAAELAGCGGVAAAGVPLNPAAGAVVQLDSTQLAVILATIRTVESGGNYQVTIRSSSASGAYAFIDSAWRSLARRAGVDTASFPRAYMAPPADQDAVAALYVNDILAANNGDITALPVVWYLPSALNNPAKMDVVPPMGANTLTPREYQTKWLRAYQQLANGQAPTAVGVTPVACPAGLTGLAGAAIDAPGGVVLPVQGLPGDTWAQDHHTYPAIDIIIPSGTPVYAWRGGTVRNIKNYGHNCYDAVGGRSCSNTCGIGMTVVDSTWSDVTWTYCHFSAIHVQAGDVITAGQHVGTSGNTGRSGTPHLHLEIRVGGTRVCPQPALQQIAATGQMIDPHQLPTSGCSF